MKDGETGLLDIVGVNLEYLWIGPPPSAGTSLVFLHEGLGCVTMWRDFPARLAAATGLGALVYSRRGYGGSDPAERPWSVHFMHDEALDVLPKVLAAAGIGRAILIGHSDGATIALIYGGAIRNPGLVGIALEAPHLFFEPKLVEQAAAIAGHYDDEMTGFRARLQRHHGANTNTMFRSWNEVCRRIGVTDQWNIEKYLPEIRVPVLAVQGEGDEFATMAHLDAIAEQSGGPVKLLKLPDCGHTPHRDKEDEVLAAMTRFIASLTAPGG